MTPLSDMPGGFDFVLDTLRAVAEGDTSRARDHLYAIAAKGRGATYAACVVWAEVIVTLALEPATRRLHPEANDDARRSGWTMGVLDDQGHMLDPEQVGEPGLVWVVRFVTAQANRDYDMSAALYAALSEDDEPEHVLTLLEVAASSLTQG